MVEPAWQHSKTRTSTARARPLLSLHPICRHAAAGWLADLRTAGFELERTDRGPVDFSCNFSWDIRGTASDRDPDLYGCPAAGMRVCALDNVQTDSYGRPDRTGFGLHCGHSMDPKRTKHGMAGTGRCGK